MIRIFLRLYLLVLLPFTLMFLLPFNPVSYFGKKLIEIRYDREFGSSYALVNHVLKDVPAEQWKDKIEPLKAQFPFGLEIIPIDRKHLLGSAYRRLLSQGYVLYRRQGFSLIYRIRDSQFALKVGLTDDEQEYHLAELQTRGIRYLVNQVIMQSDDPIKKFNEIKPFFKVPVSIKSASTFPVKGEVVKGLEKSNMYYKFVNEDPVYIYFSTTDKKYIVTAGPLTNRAKVQRYYSYAQIISPAILIAIGALIWLYTLFRELKIMNKAARKFGQGTLSTRSKLSKFATLHSQSDAFNNMAGQVEKLVDGHRDLTNAVSHELKTPLARLRFALQMQQESSNQKDKEKYTAKIEDNISELELLINELLSYARLDRSESLLKLAEHNFAHWVEQEVKHAKDYQPELLFQLQLEKSANTRILFDKSLMDKVLKNLLSNAIRHTKKKVRISAKIEQKNAIFFIEDDGDGIELKYRDQLFMPFVRVDKSRDRNTGGSGMGLALSKKIIELHGGNIEYRESQWGGAGIEVKVPI